MNIREGIRTILVDSDKCIADCNCKWFDYNCERCIDYNLNEYEYEVCKKAIDDFIDYQGNIQQYWYDKGFEEGLNKVDTEKSYQGFEDGVNAAIEIITNNCGIMDKNAFNAIQELGSLLKR